MAKLSQQKPRRNSSNVISTSANIDSVTKVKRTRKTVPRDSPPQRSSVFRGVTRHRWTGRYEAHLWDKNCWNESQNKKGRQVYLGAYDDEEAAAHSYDLAALKYWGPDTILNFPLSTYQNQIQQMEGQSREEYIGSLRRKSSGFSRGVSKYRGVARHHHNGRWEARIGRVFGNKYLYLGTYATQEEAAIAYDMAAIEYRGLNAVTNFDLSRYIKWLRPNTTPAATSATTESLLQSTVEPNLNTMTTLLAPTLDHNFGSSPSNNHYQQPPTGNIDNISFCSQLRPTNATSALGLLLHSSKFKEMMEMTTMTSGCPTTTPVGRPQPTQCNIADNNVQTMFNTHDAGSYLDQGHDHELFGELINPFMQPMLQFDFDT